ncbi:MAG: MerR family transcriptional regulator [Muribaculaceae bacterium]|nr:MerR family transcriptional regulator [Muribaculaceae bacterium]
MAFNVKSYSTIAEVAKVLGVPPSTLRWWEREAPLLRPMRTKGNQRRYTAANIETLRWFKNLVDDRGMSIAAAVEHMQTSALPYRRPVCKTDSDALRILGNLRPMVQNNPKATLMIEVIEKYLAQKTTAELPENVLQ